MARLSILVALIVSLCGCASEAERYQRNSKRAYIDKGVRLSQSEIDQIIRTVSRETTFPILEITESRSKHGEDISVYTDLSHDPQRFMVYHLKRGSDGMWHTYWHGEGSIIVVERD